MLENINVLCHSAIRLEIDNKIIYIDPYSLTSNANDADLIFITHDHYDHFSIEDKKSRKIKYYIYNTRKYVGKCNKKWNKRK